MADLRLLTYQIEQKYIDKTNVKPRTKPPLTIHIVRRMCFNSNYYVKI